MSRRINILRITAGAKLGARSKEGAALWKTEVCFHSVTAEESVWNAEIVKYPTEQILAVCQEICEQTSCNMPTASWSSAQQFLSNVLSVSKEIFSRERAGLLHCSGLLDFHVVLNEFLPSLGAPIHFDGAGREEGPPRLRPSCLQADSYLQTICAVKP